MKQHFVFLFITAICLTGCGKKAPQARYTTSDFEHPSQQLLEHIAHKQGWTIQDVEARERVFDAFEAGKQPSDADWQRLVKAADYETNDFALELAIVLSKYMADNPKYMTAKYRAPIVKWCERYMEQTNDPDAAVVGYDCYLRSGGSDAELWSSRLKARGQLYVKKIDFYNRREAAGKQ